MSENPQAARNEDDIKRKLMRRVAFAGVLIAMLLGALAFIDYLGQPAEETASSGPTFTAPVPVAKKEVTQPVKPAEPEPAPAPVATEPAPAAEATAAPPLPVADLPVRPEVAAQPALPRTESRGEVRGEARSAASPARVARPAEAATPAEGTAAASSQFAPPPERPAAPAQPQPAAVAPQHPAPPAPPRLFSGYAVQAGVFSDAQHAEELRAKLMLNGIPSTLEARVQVGPFKSREEAEAARQKLKTLGIEGILLPPKGAKR